MIGMCFVAGSLLRTLQTSRPGIFGNINQTLRNEYVLSYSPTNQARDGKVRRIKVQLINPATNEPLRINDDKGKAIKYQIVAKTGYTAPREVE